MSGTLERALGLKIASLVSGLNVYADDVANAAYEYPYATLLLLTDNLTPTGCGHKAVKRYNAATPPELISVGDRYENTLTYRITVNAVKTSSMHGQEKADGIKRELKAALLALSLSGAPITITDSAVSPSESFTLSRLRVLSGQQVPPDYNGEPYVIRAALSIEIALAEYVEKAPDGLIKHIKFNIEET